MHAVILAAGEGTRMRPLSGSLPKPMLPVSDRPLVAHTASAAVEAGADELVFVIGYEADTVREYFGDSYRGVPVEYAVQDEQLGTAHAVEQALEYVEGDFVVLNGDDLYDTAAVGSLFSHTPSLGAYTVSDPRPYGVFSLDGDRVTDVVEKPDDPPSDRVNVGAYHFPAEAAAWFDDVEMSERGEYEITDVVERLVAEREVRAVPVERWLGVGRPWELLEANEWKLGELDGRIEGKVHADAELEGRVVVEEGATVRSGVVIEGPALIREGATVGPNAYVRGATLVDEGAKVGHAVEVKNSVLSPGATIGHLSYVGDSVLGRDVNFGAGTKVANLRHDDDDVKFTVKGERTSTERRKFGVVAGDGVKTGINSSLSPGLRLNAGATTRPGETVDRDR
ncbi:bifunctional sugar-1-phosphate nucleotidylyltransferase/acetyltransferase [Saliphagus infecundisoli]|uniref:Bifunctional protein GlmU n=1 Tax=Saliphagus infecundisoli TaxID=1849069 RepID=A0ABD5QCT4_9EURY|nr:bifunctional sugar-1-phosphate nucleotidylyltransferase/acetyltransferase [Saliphagus infecundisoli]